MMRGGRSVGRKYGRGGRRTVIGALALFAAAVTVLCTAFKLAGGDISVTLPAFADKKAGDTPLIKRETVFSGEIWYALQTGAYQFREQATQAAQSDPSRGAAGLVYGKDGGWRVLLSAYMTRAEAQRVTTQLKEAHNVDAVVYAIERPSVTLRLTGTQTQLDAAAAALDYLRSAAKRMSALSRSLDDRTAVAQAVRETLTSERETVRSLLKSLGSTFRGEDAAALEGLTNVLKSQEEALKAALNAQNDTQLGAMVKRCLLTVIAGLNDAVRAL